ncbi:hypothetical protein [Microseira wollei]|nr:hypothetical protein [Microseira wollei]
MSVTQKSYIEPKKPGFSLLRNRVSDARVMGNCQEQGRVLP